MSKGSRNPRREMSRALSRVANATVAETLETQAELPEQVLYRIGVTGAPGAGKSTLISRLAARRVERGAKVAVVAIDPTSPVSQGSILGDRIRMDAVSDDPNIFIRSIPSRRAHDGLADNTADLLWAMEGHGFDEVIVETVGVGQAEYSVRAIVDTVVLVLLPESGDAVQAMKAGLLEMADIYVVNKADLPGAELMAGDIAATAARQAAPEINGGDGWVPPVLQTSSRDAASFAALDAAIEAHRAWRQNRIDHDAVRRARSRYQVQGLIGRRAEELLETMPDADLDRSPKEIYEALLQQLATAPGEGET
ncbi:MAG: methylmalonyl Co-A mutase-associated GTPase MeaB [Alphaproteobacteria bacterium]|nr:methylmalonyl Co-A mutase-associated GTPase MeaB [Alphaproteobacteria bacterium]